MEYAYDFGNTLKALRKKKNMTQTELGDKLGISKAAVSKYELGVATPPLDILRTLTAVLNVSLDYLCGTEQREKISVYNLTQQQIDMMTRLADIFREHNYSNNNQIMQNEYEILGEIVLELHK